MQLVCGDHIVDNSTYQYYQMISLWHALWYILTPWKEVEGWQPKSSLNCQIEVPWCGQPTWYDYGIEIKNLCKPCKLHSIILIHFLPEHYLSAECNMPVPMISNNSHSVSFCPLFGAPTFVLIQWLFTILVLFDIILSQWSAVWLHINP